MFSGDQPRVTVGSICSGLGVAEMAFDSINYNMKHLMGQNLQAVVNTNYKLFVSQL